jgi:hypothetical protein
VTVRVTVRLPQTGGCQCGAIRYVIDAEPVTVYACHCRECQRQSGSAFGLSAIFPASAVRITRGPAAQWRRTTDSGRISTASLCGICGNRIMNSSGGPFVSLKPGTLDDAGWIQAVGHIWTGSAQDWTAPLRKGLDYAGQPADFTALGAAWAARRDA